MKTVLIVAAIVAGIAVIIYFMGGKNKLPSGAPASPGTPATLNPTVATTTFGR